MLYNMSNSPGHPCSCQMTHLAICPYTLEGEMNQTEKFTKSQEDEERLIAHDEKRYAQDEEKRKIGMKKKVI